MRSGQFVPTLNLDNIDPRCGEVDYIQNGMRAIDTEFVMNNNFSFGGVNTSLVFKRWQQILAEKVLKCSSRCLQLIFYCLELWN